MENTENTQSDTQDELKVDELEMLKSRARLMGVDFSNNIGIDTLKARIEAKMGEGDSAAVKEPNTPVQENALQSPNVKGVKCKTLRQHLYDENMKLVRIRVSCMDPKKANLPGEIFTVANEYLGTVRKFVPFGEDTDDGFHVPYCIYKMMDARKFLQISTRKDKVTKQLVVDSRYVREFSIEILPPLTQKELQRLAMEQSASGRIG